MNKEIRNWWGEATPVAVGCVLLAMTALVWVVHPDHRRHNAEDAVSHPSCIMKENER